VECPVSRVSRTPISCRSPHSRLNHYTSSSHLQLCPMSYISTLPSTFWTRLVQHIDNNTLKALSLANRDIGEQAQRELFHELHFTGWLFDVQITKRQKPAVKAVLARIVGLRASRVMPWVERVVLKDWTQGHPVGQFLFSSPVMRLFNEPLMQVTSGRSAKSCTRCCTPCRTSRSLLRSICVSSPNTSCNSLAARRGRLGRSHCDAVLSPSMPACPIISHT